MNLGRIVAALRRHRLVADVTLALALAALAAVTGVALVAPRAQVESPSTPVIVAWAAALAAPLVLRRRWPLAVLAVTTLHFTRYWAVGQVNEIASWVISLAWPSTARCLRRPPPGRHCPRKRLAGPQLPGRPGSAAEATAAATLHGVKDRDGSRIRPRRPCDGCWSACPWPLRQGMRFAADDASWHRGQLRCGRRRLSAAYLTPD